MPGDGLALPGRYHPFVWLAAATAVRSAELAALRRRDVDPLIASGHGLPNTRPRGGSRCASRILILCLARIRLCLARIRHRGQRGTGNHKGLRCQQAVRESDATGFSEGFLQIAGPPMFDQNKERRPT